MREDELALMLENFPAERNCSQTVLAAFAGRFGLTTDQALRIATGFGAGLGRSQELCGAVTGAVMVLGLAFGRGENEGKDRENLAYARTAEFLARFKAAHSSLGCRELLDGCDFSTPEGQARFRNGKMIEDCRRFVRTSLKILHAMLPANS